LVHAGTPERLELLRQQVQARLPGVPIRMVGEVAPVIGAHVGPGTVCIVCIRTA
jgi:fatty acid-binding protein DegV